MNYHHLGPKEARDKAFQVALAAAAAHGLGAITTSKKATLPCGCPGGTVLHRTELTPQADREPQAEWSCGNEAHPPCGVTAWYPYWREDPNSELAEAEAARQERRRERSQSPELYSGHEGAD